MVAGLGAQRRNPLLFMSGHENAGAQSNQLTKLVLAELARRDGAQTGTRLQEC